MPRYCVIWAVAVDEAKSPTEAAEIATKSKPQCVVVEELDEDGLLVLKRFSVHRKEPSDE